jgi:hypothetical protein
MACRKISTDSLQLSEPPDVPGLFPKLERIAEAEERLTPGLDRRQPVAPIGGSAELDVETHLLVEILHAPPARDEEPEPSKHRQAIRNTRTIAPVTPR